jgi:GAF domain-containing protein
MQEPLRQEASAAGGLFAVFAHMSGLLLSRETVGKALELVTSLATETLPATLGAGVTLIRDGGRTATAAASDTVVEQADALQYLLGEGPCLSALRSSQTVRVDDTRSDTRWPRWTEAVEPLGMRAALSTPMHVKAGSIGAIKVYSRQPGAYDERGERVLALFASQAAILLANMQSFEDTQRLTDQLKAAIRSRDVLAMAKGSLMTGHGIDEPAAFAILAQTAQRSNENIRVVAQRVIDVASDGVG